MDAEKIGKSIAFLRKQFRMTQSDLAGKLKVSDKTVSKWENGHGIPDISVISKIAIALDVDVESLLEGNITHHKLNWVGALFMEYPDGIYSDTQMFGMRTVEFQSSFFLLAGIKKLYLFGNSDEIQRADKYINSERGLGIDVQYVVYPETEKDFLKIGSAFPAGDGIMCMVGFCFLYGKDITKCFRRIMYDETRPVKLVDFNGAENGICFYPGKFQFSNFMDWDICRPYILERGIISFPICSQEDLLDAAMMIRIIEKHQGEKVACLEEIAAKRNF